MAIDTCLKVQISIGPDDPGCVITQGHEHSLGQSLVPVPLPLMVTLPQANARLDFCSIFQRRAPTRKNILLTAQQT